MAVLNGVDLALYAGECVALVGDNGAGKTTLLRCLAAECRPTQGSIRWFEDVYGGPQLKRRIGFVAHEGRLCPQLTARENLIFAARMCRADHAGQRADAWLDATGLNGHADRKPEELSRGMRQRLAMARALRARSRPRLV